MLMSCGLSYGYSVLPEGVYTHKNMNILILLHL